MLVPASYLEVPRPHDFTIEVKLIGTLLEASPEEFSSISVRVTEDLFMDSGRRLIVRALAVLAEKKLPFEYDLVLAEMKANYAQPEKAAACLDEHMLQGSPFLAAEGYLKILEGLRFRRSLQDVCLQSWRDAGNLSVDAAELVAKVGQALQGALQSRGGKVRHGHIAEAVDRVVAELELARHSDVPVIPFGFQALDNMMLGLSRGDYCVIAARPGIGKTALAQAIALRQAKSGVPVYFSSYEMAEAPIVWRFLSPIGSLPLGKFRSPKTFSADENRRLEWAQGELKKLPIYLDDEQVKLEEVMTRWTLAAQRGYKVFFFDYLQLLGRREATSDNDLRHAIARASARFKEFAKTTGTAVIALAQLKRDIDLRSPHYAPLQSDVEECGKVEQDVDAMIGLQRLSRYVPTVPIEKADAHILKQRNGPVGIASLLFVPQFSTFGDAETSDLYGGLR